MLKDWINANGPITVDSQTLDFRAAPRKSFDDGRPVFDYLVDRDIDPDEAWKAFTPTMTAVKRLVKAAVDKDEAKAIIEKIEAMQTTTTGTRFGFDKEE